MDLTIDYYNRAIKLFALGKLDRSMFYFGAALHIVQDMTVPQHANIRLLDNHRQYETYIKKSYEYIDEFQVDTGTYVLDSIEDYILFNTRVAIKMYDAFKNISNERDRFYRIGRCGLPLAERTTAGAMVTFYKDIFSKNSI